MKKFLTVGSLSLAALLMQFGCTPQNNTNTGTVTTSTATPEPTPDKAAITAELTRIENDFPRVLKEHDVEAIRRVEADDIVEVLPDGSTTTKTQDLVDLQAGNLSADSWEIAELTVTVLDSDAAFVNGRSVIKGGKVKGPDGKSIDISGEYRFVDTFARRDGQWKLVASVSVKVQKPTASPSPKASPATSPATKETPSTKPSPAMRPSPATKPVPKPTLPTRTKTP